MPSTFIIADTSCLIALSRIEKLNLLKEVYQEITITKTVANEYGGHLPNWIKIKEPTDYNQIKLLALNLDIGEATSIVLALERKGSVLIIDERKGRAIANSLGIKITGLLGVILRAKTSGKIKSTKNILEKLEKAEFRISNKIKQKVLKLSKEI